MNELLIKHNLSDLAEEKNQEDVVEECVEEETGFKADCVFTAENLEAALNLVTFSSTSGQFKSIKNKKNLDYKMIVYWQVTKTSSRSHSFFFFDTCLCSFISKSQTR